MAADAENSKVALLQQEAEEKQEASKKVQDQMRDLTAAKDRAQLSQASAMSILDVKVLADLIRGGPGSTMYIPLLVLVTLALLLQVIVGFISLMISNIKNRYHKFGFGGTNCCANHASRESGEGDIGRQEAMADAQAIYDLRPVTLEDENTFGTTVKRTRVPADSHPEHQGNPPEKETLAESDDRASLVSFHEEQIELPEIRIAPVSAEPPKLSLAEIYGTAHPEEEGGHMPPPYDPNEPKNMKAKTVTRLRALVDQMVESKEGEIETKINTEFLEEKLARNEIKLKQLQETVAEMHAQEGQLATDWEEAKGHWEKIVEEMSLLKAPYAIKTRRSQLKKKLEQLRKRQHELETLETSALENLPTLKEKNEKFRVDAARIEEQNAKERQELEELGMSDEITSSNAKATLDDFERKLHNLEKDVKFFASYAETKTAGLRNECTFNINEIRTTIDYEKQRLEETENSAGNEDSTGVTTEIPYLITRFQEVFDWMKEQKEELSRVMTTDIQRVTKDLEKITRGKKKIEADQLIVEKELQNMQDDLADDTKTNTFQMLKEPQQVKQKFHLLEIEERHAYDKLCTIEKQRTKAKEAKADAERVESEIRTIKQEKERQEKRLREFKMNERRFKFYQKMAADIEKRKSLEVVMFWQNVINCLLYTVFVLNAFIATLSLV